MWTVALIVLAFTIYSFYTWAFLIRHRKIIKYIERDISILEEREKLFKREVKSGNSLVEGKYKEILSLLEKARKEYYSEVEKFNRKLRSPIFFLPAKLFGEKPIEKID
ncbi:hypothetical protein [Thermotoga sp. KOL6]|uniref:hypothetical protein n=1 Tax=Thermotoga sp. KOL6 TaxID=126741 RepID=UPI000C78EB5B|nr:hypothetical protein [Thermotoga sp. KOL6]PLV59098.1 hypothetical protein AS005_04900 [Thermotoga sp. KOL6]